MDNIIEQINSLQEKKEKAQTLLTRYRVQLEGLVKDRDEVVQKLKDVYETTVEEAPHKLAELKTELDRLLNEAKKSLDKINL